MSPGSRSSSPRRSGKPSDRSGDRSKSGRPGAKKGPSSRSRSNGDGRGRRREKPKPKPPARAERSGWGSVAQHGAAGATHGQKADEAEGPKQFSPEETRKFEQRQARRAAAAERIEGLRSEAKAAIDRSSTSTSAAKKDQGTTVDRRPLPGRPPAQKDARKELAKLLGADAGEKAWKNFRRAAKAFEREQYTDARKLLAPMVDLAPSVVDLRELYGLTFYSLGRWQEAIDQLEQFRSDSGTSEQHPVLMDAHRALEHWGDVDYLWKELGESSPSAPLVIEGRIVRAGAEADRGNLQAAIGILEKGWKLPRNPQEHHLRRAYALADLYERAGKVPRARAMFKWIVGIAPDYGDVAHRLRNL